MKKRAFLIHGWEGYPEEGWKPWLRDKLTKQGFEVVVPAMPDTDSPKMNAWLKHLRTVVGNPDKNCYFVGHSLGCITILRYLEGLKPGKKIGGVVLVAGFTSNLGFKDLKSFFQSDIDWEKIKKHCRKFVAVHSNNDPWVSLHYGQEFFQGNLGAKFLIDRNKKHFSGDDGINKLPSVLKSVLEISK